MRMGELVKLGTPQEILTGMGSEMRSDFDHDGAAGNGVQTGRQRQLLLLQQQLLQVEEEEEEEKIGFFELGTDTFYNATSTGSSSDSDYTVNINYMPSSNTNTYVFYAAERSNSGLEFHDQSFFHIQNATDSFNLDGHRHVFDQHSSVERPDMPSGTAAFTSSNSSNSAPTGYLTTEASTDSSPPEDTEIFPDTLFKYINGILMEDDIETKFDIYPEHPALLAAEKPFYEIIGEKFPPSAFEPPPYFRSNQESLDDGADDYFESFNRIGDANLMPENSRPTDEVGYHQLKMNHDSLDYSSASFTYKNCAGVVIHEMEDCPPGLSITSELFPAWQFQKGLEEARKFLPSDDKLVINLEPTGFLMPLEPKEGRKEVQVKPKDGETKHVIHESPRGKKNHNEADLVVQEGRSCKQSATCTEEIVRTKMVDEILLGKVVNCVSIICEPLGELNDDPSKSSNITTQSKESGSSKGRGKRLQPKKEVVDMQTLLIHCAQCVSIDDHRSAYELLKQIRKHADPHGDANQRLAHYFVDGLEARLAGTGSQIYHSLIMRRIPITDLLKAFKLHMTVSPFKRIAYYFSNQTILDVAEKATRLHIIDFGISYGFQWPCFMQRLYERPGGPPKLRITGIDRPASGFRPTELIDETGRRIADYARSFSIQFEYHAIATNWEAIREEDLNIDRDELLIVNCIFRMKNVADETVRVDSPRDVVLNMIRKLNPAVFIHGVINGSYNAPFFVTRFREALFYYSALYDQFEAIMPREDESRQLIEDVYGREALNVISCEGSERMERPETYKQWQVRNLRAGFMQLPLNSVIVKKARAKYKASYHKDFVIDDDNQWLLQGWKGKILVALSTWKTNISS